MRYLRPVAHDHGRIAAATGLAQGGVTATDHRDVPRQQGHCFGAWPMQGRQAGVPRLPRLGGSVRNLCAGKLLNAGSDVRERPGRHLHNADRTLSGTCPHQRLLPIRPASGFAYHTRSASIRIPRTHPSTVECKCQHGQPTSKAFFPGSVLIATTSTKHKRWRRRPPARPNWCPQGLRRRHVALTTTPTRSPWLHSRNDKATVTPDKGRALPWLRYYPMAHRVWA